jgi:hypothetical protein
MDLSCEERPSDSPLIERVWRSQSDRAGSFVSMAETHWGIVVTRYCGRTTLTVRGPETRATPAHRPADAEWFGIQFKHGTMMPDFPPRMVMDRQDVNLPEASSKSFWLCGSAWQFPDFDNVETFVNRLARDDLLIYDPIVAAVLRRKPVTTSVRTVQRRFLRATGLTNAAFAQIERARYATALLKQGVSILDVVYQAGYTDQPHLTRSLKRLIGETPAQIISRNRVNPLSFLYKTAPF